MNAPIFTPQMLANGGAFVALAQDEMQSAPP